MIQWTTPFLSLGNRQAGSPIDGTVSSLVERRASDQVDGTALRLVERRASLTKNTVNLLVERTLRSVTCKIVKRRHPSIGVSHRIWGTEAAELRQAFVIESGCGYSARAEAAPEPERGEPRMNLSRRTSPTALTCSAIVVLLR